VIVIGDARGSRSARPMLLSQSQLATPGSASYASFSKDRQSSHQTPIGTSPSRLSAKEKASKLSITAQTPRQTPFPVKYKAIECIDLTGDSFESDHPDPSSSDTLGPPITASRRKKRKRDELGVENAINQH
jgi:hypothetical protein